MMLSVPDQSCITLQIQHLKALSIPYDGWMKQASKIGFDKNQVWTRETLFHNLSNLLCVEAINPGESVFIIHKHVSQK